MFNIFDFDIATIYGIVAIGLFLLVAVLRVIDYGVEDNPFSLKLKLENTWYRRIARSSMIIAFVVFVLHMHELQHLSWWVCIISALVLGYVIMVVGCFAAAIIEKLVRDLYTWITE